MATKKKAFGGYGVNFKGCTETMEQVFGKKHIGTGQVMKIMWAYIKKHNLGSKA